jgi:hypothetical protein
MREISALEISARTMPSKQVLTSKGLATIQSNAAGRGKKILPGDNREGLSKPAPTGGKVAGVETVGCPRLFR